MQDYRDQSWREIAAAQAKAREEAAAKKAAEQSKTSISINPKYIVSGGGQVAIRGSPQENLVVSTVSSPSQEQRTLPPAAPEITRESYIAESPGAQPVSISAQSLGKQLAMSIRDDNPYKAYSITYSFKGAKDERNSDNRGDDLLGTGNKIPSAEDKAVQKYNQEIDFLQGWQSGYQERVQRGEEIFRGKGGDSYLESVGRLGLSLPGKVITEYPEGVAIGLYKGYVVAKGAFSRYQPIQEQARTDIKTAAKQTPTAFFQTFDITKPSGLVNTAAFVALPSLTGKVVGGVKNVYVKAGSEYIPPERVFDAEALRGETKFPGTSSVKQSLKEFNTPNKEGSIVVQTSSPAKLAGNTAGVGGSAAVGLEDSGIYVTPEGRGSPYFLRVGDSKATTQYRFTINPFGSSDVPTVTKFKVREVVQYPREVVESPGFSAASEYQKTTLASQGVAVLTKRSEVGQGALTPQMYPATSDIYGVTPSVAKRLGVSPDTKVILKGTPIKETGTSEIEAVVPQGAEFEYTPKTFAGRIKGFDSYTELNGKPIAIRESELVVGDRAFESRILGKRSISKERILRESNSLSRLSESDVSFSPTSFSYSGSVSRMGSASRIGSASSFRSVASSSVVSGSSKVSGYVSSGSSYSSANGGPGGFGGGSSSSYSPVSKSSSSSSVSSVSTLVSGSSGGSSSSYGFSKSESQRRIDIPLGGKGGSEAKVYGFDVRRQGTFRTVGSGLDLKQAISLAKSRVGNTAAASFRITRNGSPIELSESLGGQYYRKGSVVIEKPEFRIKSGGELNEITFKGVRANKRGGLI